MATALNVSTEDMDCARVVEALKVCRISSHVTRNVSVVPGGEGSTVRTEHGCRVVFSQEETFDRDVRRLWSMLQRGDKTLVCAFVESPNYRGCIWDYLGATRCPGSTS